MRRGTFDDLATFAAVARSRSFTRAAAEMGISPSALSHAMRSFEARLGVVLLARTTRSVAPTAAGERLLRSLDPALAEVEKGLAALADWRGEPSGSLRLTTFSSAARSVLDPALPHFLLAHPAVTVEVDVADRPVDIVAAGFDAGIRFGDSIERDMTTVRVGPDLRAIVVGAPAYLAEHPPPRTPTELQAHDCIGYRLAGAGGLLPWDFARDGREERLRPDGRLVVNDGELVKAAVRAGAGLGYVLEDEVAADVAAGRLVRVLDDWCQPFSGCHLYHPAGQATPALRALIETLRWRNLTPPPSAPPAASP